VSKTVWLVQMKECIYDIKLLSNMIVVRFAEDDIFMNILKSHIARNFTSTMVMRHSTFIFNRENETLKRKIFLTWMHNLYQKTGNVTDKKLLDKMLESEKLTICLQIVPKARMVESLRIFAYFFGQRILFRSDDIRSPMFAYLNALLKHPSLATRHDGVNFHVDLSKADSYWVQRVKRVFEQKLSIGGKSFNLMYGAKEFDSFFAKFAASKEQDNGFKFRFNFGGFNHQKAPQNDTETMSDEQKRIRYLLLLGCTKSDDMKTIKKRYFVLAKEYHPDMHHGKDSYTVKTLTEKFIQIKDAYDFILGVSRDDRMCA
jgi:DnaJ domain